jgi:hypothetical protein
VSAGDIDRHARELEAELGTGVRKKRRAMSRSTIDRIVAETARRREAKDWKGAKPGNLVALWAWCHGAVYGVVPEEVSYPAQFGKACIRAAQVLKASFDGDVVRCVDFVRWTWSREMRRRKNVEANQERRIGWALQFSPGMVSDWRVSTAGRMAVPGK